MNHKDQQFIDSAIVGVESLRELLRNGLIGENEYRRRVRNAKENIEYVRSVSKRARKGEG